MAETEAKRQRGGIYSFPALLGLRNTQNIPRNYILMEISLLCNHIGLVSPHLTCYNDKSANLVVSVNFILEGVGGGECGWFITNVLISLTDRQVSNPERISLFGNI